MTYEVVSPDDDGGFIVHYVGSSFEDAMAWCEKHQTAADWVVRGRR